MYVLNGATGEVHEGSCPRLGRMHAANLVPWDPGKAHLALGARACTECLKEVPATGRQVDLLEDPDGAPYQEAVQAFVRHLLPTGVDLDLLVAALEETAWYAFEAGIREGYDETRPTNPHRKPEAEG